MKSFRILFLCLLNLYLFSLPVSSQVNPLKKNQQKTNQKLNKRIDKTFDKTTDKKDKKDQPDMQKGSNSKEAQGENPTHPEKDYLPEVFNMYKPVCSLSINLYDIKNQKAESYETHFRTKLNSMECHSAKLNIPGNKHINNELDHIANAYTNGKLKGYIDKTVLINIPYHAL